MGDHPMECLREESRKKCGCSTDGNPIVEEVARFDEAQCWTEVRKSDSPIGQNMKTLDKITLNVTSIDYVLVANMDRVDHEVGKPICPVYQDVVGMSGVVQDRSDVFDPFLTEVAPKFIRVEELLRAALMAECGASRSAVELRKGVYRVFRLVRRKDMSLIVTSYRRYEVSLVGWVEIKVPRHLKHYLSREKGVRGDAGVISCLKGVRVRNPHAVVCLEVLS
jgi:hypothetical protein